MNEKKAQDILKNWVDFFCLNDSHRFLNLYHQDASLLATLNPQYLNSEKMIKDYFVNNLFSRKQMRVVLNAQNYCQNLNQSICILTGFYVFSFIDQGKKVELAARYTFIVNIEQSRPIVHHHSSVLPN